MGKCFQNDLVIFLKGIANSNEDLAPGRLTGAGDAYYGFFIYHKKHPDDYAWVGLANLKGKSFSRLIFASTHSLSGVEHLIPYSNKPSGWDDKLNLYELGSFWEEENWTTHGFWNGRLQALFPDKP